MRSSPGGSLCRNIERKNSNRDSTRRREFVSIILEGDEGSVEYTFDSVIIINAEHSSFILELRTLQLATVARGEI